MNTQSAETTAPLPQLSPEAKRDFAIIIPAYNEADNMPDLVRELGSLFQRHGLSGEVVLVDDGSTDGTADRARAEASGWSHFKVVSHRTNFGKTEALLTGAAATEARWLILFDADIQHSVDEIPRYLGQLSQGWDIVTGRKVGAYEKRKVSSVYNWLNRRLFKVPVSDLNSMKGFRREVLDEVHLRHDWHRFFVVLAVARGFSVTELDIALLPRRHGQAKYSGRSRIIVGFLDLVSVAFFVLFSRKPMLLFGVTGLAMAATGVVVGLVTIVLRLGPHSWMPGFGFRPLLYLVILLEVLGFLLFGFGFIAELVAQQQADLDALQRKLRTPDPARRD